MLDISISETIHRLQDTLPSETSPCRKASKGVPRESTEKGRLSKSLSVASCSMSVVGVPEDQVHLLPPAISTQLPGGWAMIKASMAFTKLLKNWSALTDMR